MTTNKPWLLYGATGVTGELIAAEAVRRGHRPILAGRSAEKVRAVAEKLDLDWAAFSLDDPRAVDAAVRQASLVLLAAGPFGKTSAPLIKACLAAGVPYLDISNDIQDLLASYTYDPQARQRGMAIISGAGFGVTASSGLARYALDLLPEANQLEIYISLYTAQTSQAARLSGFEVLAQGGKVYRAGLLVNQRIGQGAQQINFPDGRRAFVPVPSGDLAAAYRTTGIPTISVALDLGIKPLAARVALPLMQKIVSIPALRRMMTGKPKAGGSPWVIDPHRRTYLLAIARAASGKEVRAWLETGEGYAFSAAAAVRAVEETLKQHPLGALTPAQAFGAGFIQTIEDVHLSIEDAQAGQTQGLSASNLI